MRIESLDVVFFSLSFLVPGFVLYSTLSFFVPLREKSEHISFLSFLTLSAVNYGFCSWLIYLLFFSAFFTGHVLRSAIAWGFVILLSPILLGAIWGYFSQQETVRRGLQWLGLSPRHIIPTSWDYKFSRIKEPTWLLITLKDGSKVAGLFGSRSFSSSDPGERDIYVQRIFERDDQGNWKPAEQDDGILISAAEIKYIEFRTNK